MQGIWCIVTQNLGSGVRPSRFQFQPHYRLDNLNIGLAWISAQEMEVPVSLIASSSSSLEASENMYFSHWVGDGEGQVSEDGDGGTGTVYTCFARPW